MYYSDAGTPATIGWNVQNLYERKRLSGQLRRFSTKLTCRPFHLASLDEIAESLMITARRFAGLQTVPIRQIGGSENRTQDFDNHFNPLNERTRSRWKGIALAQLHGVNMPPVELIQIGGTYFVRDGHHRISVACALGQTHIEATVTVWDVMEQPIAGTVQAFLRE